MTTDPEGNKNVFQLWKEGGERLPFKVIRWTWNPATSTFLVERIEIGKWPYGKAWGRFLLETARKLPAGAVRHDILKEIRKFSARIAALKVKK